LARTAKATLDSSLRLRLGNRITGGSRKLPGVGIISRCAAPKHAAADRTANRWAVPWSRLLRKIFRSHCARGRIGQGSRHVTKRLPSRPFPGAARWPSFTSHRPQGRIRQGLWRRYVHFCPLSPLRPPGRPRPRILAGGALERCRLRIAPLWRFNSSPNWGVDKTS
jgi:hypothetical protein